MSHKTGSADPTQMATILAILDENRTLTVATVRPDGWPQATIVGYVHEGLDLYFVVASNSQKRANIALEPRVSIALGHDRADHIRGLSMAAHATEVTDTDEVARLNLLISLRYPDQTLFAPREVSAALMRATPVLVSVIDHSKGPGPAELVEVVNEVGVSRVG